MIVGLVWLSLIAAGAPRAEYQTGLALSPHHNQWQIVHQAVHRSVAWNAGLRAGQVIRPYYTTPDQASLTAYLRERGPSATGDRLVLIPRRWSARDDLMLLALGLVAVMISVATYLRTARRSPAIRFLALSSSASAQLLIASCFAIYPEWTHPASWMLMNVLAFGLASVVLNAQALRWRWIRLLMLGGLVALLVAYLYALALRPSALEVLDRVALVHRLLCVVVGGLGASRGFSLNAQRPGRRHGLAVLALMVVVLLPSALSSVPGLYPPPPSPFAASEWAIWFLVPLGLAWMVWRKMAGDVEERPAESSLNVATRETGDPRSSDAELTLVPGRGSRRAVAGKPTSSAALDANLLAPHVENGREDLLASGRPLASAPVYVDQVIAETLARMQPALERVGARVSIGETFAVQVDRATLSAATAGLLQRALELAATESRPQLRLWAERSGERIRVWAVVNRGPSGQGPLEQGRLGAIGVSPSPAGEVLASPADEVAWRGGAVPQTDRGRGIWVEVRLSVSTPG